MGGEEDNFPTLIRGPGLLIVCPLLQWWKGVASIGLVVGVMNGVTPPGARRKGGGCVLHPLRPGKMKTESKEVLNTENEISVQEGKLRFLCFAAFFVFL